MIVDPTLFARSAVRPADTDATDSDPTDSEPAGALPAAGTEKPCSWRQLKKQQTREAIHLAAYALVAERGYAHVTVADICAAAGVSERTFFNYFPSKTAATLGLPETAISTEQELDFLRSGGPLVGDLCALVAHVADNRDDNLSRIRDLMKREPDLFAALHQWTSGLRHHVLGLCEQRTTPAKARLAVSLVFGALNLHADSAYTTNRPSAESLRRTVAELGAIAGE
ncbi:TetR/AcrR family transcriptional regulator [Raineyella fluvialis]|uniref:TetR family transcriptional regulator n=1 Tax=Raineyella fluvialis TaxID=2662261 RepID=A0A5Q2F9R9_9ACTN|nr:TetR family transcriptional regulator [Raineyella fluvialis]QGF23720.1 TetR family transcriptional regulator [Raineyella fluvialis]